VVAQIGSSDTTGSNTHRPRVRSANFKLHLQASLEAANRDGDLRSKSPVIIPTREDKRYRSYKVQPLPETNASSST
jgi:hypothetical protein